MITRLVNGWGFESLRWHNIVKGVSKMRFDLFPIQSIDNLNRIEWLSYKNDETRNVTNRIANSDVFYDVDNLDPEYLKDMVKDRLPKCAELNDINLEVVDWEQVSTKLTQAQY